MCSCFKLIFNFCIVGVKITPNCPQHEVLQNIFKRKTLKGKIQEQPQIDVQGRASEQL